MLTPSERLAPQQAALLATRPIAHSRPLSASHAGRWGLVLATTMVGALATWNSLRTSISMDEAYTAYTTQLSLPATIHRALTYELQAPGYFVLLNLWRRLDSSVLFARALSTLAAAVFVLVMAGVARRLHIRSWPAVALASAAIPGVVWAASDMRGYALSLMLTALTLYFYVGIVSSEGRVARSDAAGYILSATALLYVVHFGGFVLLGQWIGAIVARRRVVLLTGLLAIVACALLPVAAIFAVQARTHPFLGPTLDVGDHWRYALWKTAVTIVEAFAAQDSGAVYWPHALLVVVLMALAIPLARVFYAESRPDRLEASWLVLAVVPFVVIASLRLFDLVLIRPRHLLVAVPAAVLLYVFWIDRIRPVALRNAATMTTGVMLAAALVAFETGAPTENWRGAAEYVAARAESGDVVLVYDPDLILPFAHYFGALAPAIRIYGMPVDLNYAKYDPVGNYSITDTAVVAQRVQAVAGAARSIWFVSSRRFADGSANTRSRDAKPATTRADAALMHPPPDMARGQKLVLEYLRAHYAVDSAVDAPGARIDHATDR